MFRRIYAVLAVTVVAAVIAPGDAQALGLPEGFSTVEQVAGLDGPTALAYAPDGRLFVAEKAGRVRVVGADGRLHPTPVIDISDHVNSYWDRGLLGIAVDADFATNRSIYLLYVHEANALDPTGAKTSRLTRIRVTSDNELEDPEAPETVVLGSVSQAPCPAPAPTVDCIPADGFSHAIGTVRADPDGTLWLGSGDGTSWRGADAQALRTYDENSLSGKLMHVDREGRGVAGHPFCPTERDLTKTCTKLYAKGFRNPFRFHLRPGAGPIVGDVGWEMREELDVTRAGRSYGWPCYEGSFRTSGYKDMAGCTAQYDLGPTAHDPPSYEYAQAPGDATIVAGPRYEGEQYPAPYRGDWFFGDYSKGLIWRTTIDDQGKVAAPTQFATGFEGGVDLERAPNGDLVYVSFGAEAGTGSVQRIVYGNRAPLPVASATPERGIAPLDVTVSAEGTTDPDGEAMTYEWDLDSDGSTDATGPSASHTYAAGVHAATLTVRDARGLEASDTVQILASETPPSASLLAPSPGSFRYGEPIELKGSATDIQDGELGDAALHWRITHPPRPAHPCRRGGPHRGRDHVHPAGRPRRGLRARGPSHGARLRRPRGHRGRDAATRDDRPAPRELAARGGARLRGDRRDRAHPAEGGDRLPPDRVGARRVRARRAALHVRSLVGRRRAAARDRHPGQRADADGGLRAGAGAPGSAAAGGSGPRAPAARRRSGAARSPGRSPGHARRLGRQASLAPAAAAA